MYVIGLDIGTTGTKAVLIDSLGKIVGQGYYGYELYVNGCCVEQDSQDWWKASCIAVQQACRGQKITEIVALSVSAQGATTTAMDMNNQVLGKAITWLDTRATKETALIREKLGEEYVYQSTGWKLSPSLDAAKILYMKGSRAYRGATHYLSTLEYINFKLTRHMVIDPTCAGIRQLYKIEEMQWDEKILTAIGCTEEELPDILPTASLLGTLTPEAAKALCLHEGIRIYNGAHDQYCASLGSGAVHSGNMMLSTGTAWAVMGISNAPIFSKSYISSCPHPVNGLYGSMVSLTGAGNAYQWMKDKFFQETSFQNLDAKCSERIGKTKNLIFLPWLSGNLYPFYSSSAKGGFIGADLSCDRYDFALSIMESAAFGVRAAVEDFAAQGCKTDKIYLMGGASKSRIWIDILQSVVSKQIVRLNIADVCALGAAAIALIQEGFFSTYEEAAGNMAGHTLEVPTDTNRVYYEEKYKQYQKTLEYMSGFYDERA